MKNKSVIIRAIFSLAIIIYLFSIIDLKKLLSIFGSTHIVLAVLVSISVILDRALMAFKWNILVRALHIQIPFKESFRVYLVGSFVGMFFPSSVGGDVVRLFSVGVNKGERGGIAASIVVERIVGLIALIFLFFLATIFLACVSYEETKVYLFLALALLIGSSLFFVLSFYLLPMKKLEQFQTGFLGKLRQVVEAYHVFQKERKALLIFFILSFFEHLIPILGNYLTAKALGIAINPLAFFLVVPVILICARLPISLDGLGVQEALYLFLFPLAGLSQTDAFSVGLMIRFLTIVAMLPGAWLFMVSKRTLQKTNQQNA